MQIEWLEPWRPVNAAERQLLEAELRKEIGKGHELFGQHPTIVGRRDDQDDILCEIGDSKTVATVHLTWRTGREKDPSWPATRVYENIESWIEMEMKPERDV
ncbi:MAG: hypothetical protein ACR2NU_15945 [Aeoliella sp.]